MRIMVVKLSAIGDVVHTLPALAQLRRLYPEAHITWVIEEAASDLVMGNPHVDEVIVSRRKGWLKDIKAGKFGAFKEMGRFVKQLRRLQYDLAIDFHGLLKSSLIIYLARATRKLGFDSMQEGSGLFLTEKVPEVMDKHAVQRYLDLVRYLYEKDAGARRRPPSSPEEGEFVISVTEREDNEIEKLLREHGLAGRQFVAVNPIAFWKTKLWEERKFSRLCDLIIEQCGRPVIFTGTERQGIERIQAQMLQASLNFAGKTTLRELASLYRRAACVITTDSGPMHIAAAMGTPVVALFGPTDPRRTGPFGKGHVIIRKELACMPCFRKKCTLQDCMRLIGVEEVFEAAQGLICRKLI